jgi:hypothetical protein
MAQFLRPSMVVNATSPLLTSISLIFMRSSRVIDGIDTNGKLVSDTNDDAVEEDEVEEEDEDMM